MSLALQLKSTTWSVYQMQMSYQTILINSRQGVESANTNTEGYVGLKKPFTLRMALCFDIPYARKWPTGLPLFGVGRDGICKALYSQWSDIRNAFIQTKEEWECGKAKLIQTSATLLWALTISHFRTHLVPSTRIPAQGMVQLYTKWRVSVIYFLYWSLLNRRYEHLNFRRTDKSLKS